MRNIELYNGYRIPCIGYGTYPQKKSLRDNIPLVINTGYQLVDTSDNYLNEEFIGDGIKSIREGKKHLCIVTKFSQPMRTKELDKCFYESKKKLNRRIDIYLLHWPYPFLWKLQWRKMEALYKNGECKAIGVCNFEEKHLKKLLKICDVKPMIDQFERHPMFQQNRIFEFCFDHNIQVMSYSPIARRDKLLIENAILQDIARKYNKTAEQIILRWNIQNRCIPIPGSSSEIHIKENLDVFDFTLTKEEMMRINSMEAGYRIRFNPNKRFKLREKVRFLYHRVLCFFQE